MPVFRVLAILALILAIPGKVAASSLMLSFEVTVGQFLLGSVDDPLGMDGATVSFLATFNDNAIWQDSGFGSVFAVADSHSFTIAGASVAASNGTYSDPGGLVIESSPGVGAEFLSPPFPSSSRPTIFLDSGFEFVLGFFLSPTAISDQPGIGEFIDGSHFATSFSFDTFITDTATSSSPVQNHYEVASVESAPSTIGGPTNPDVAPVPLPTSLPLIAGSLGLLGLLGLRSRIVAKAVT